MPLEIGTIETVAIREVWPKEDADFTPWLRSHIGELDKVLGLGLTNARSEVGAGDFSIDIVTETNLGDIVIENQFGRSDHRHLGQLVTYLSYREVQRAHTPARGQRLLYRIAVNRRESRVVVTNASGRWQGALAALIEKRPQIDADFGAGDLPKALEWPELVTAGRWAIRYTVEASYLDGTDSTAMRELNRASAAMRRVLEPHLKELDPALEEESSDPSDDVLGTD